MRAAVIPKCSLCALDDHACMTSSTSYIINIRFQNFRLCICSICFRSFGSDLSSASVGYVSEVCDNRLIACVPYKSTKFKILAS